MATLLSWLSGAVKNVENTVGGAVNNVAHAIAPQPQRQVPQRPQFTQVQQQPLAVQRPMPVPQAPRPQAPHTTPISDAINNIGHYVGDTIHNAQDFAAKAGNTLAYPIAASAQSISETKKGVTPKQIQQGRQQIAQTLNHSFVSPNEATGKATPVQFAKDFTNVGVQASQYIPAGKAVGGLTDTAGFGINQLKNILANNAKQAAIYGTASTANDVIQGHGITPQSLAANYVAPLALGTGAELGGKVLATGSKQVVKSAVKAYNTPENGFAKVPFNKDQKSLFDVPKQPNENLPNNSKVVNAFNSSTNQKNVGSNNGVNFEVGSFGANALSRKATSADRISPKQLQETIPYLKRPYASDSNPNSYRSGNIAWVADMPNGEKRVVYTRQNAKGNEEIINAHSIQKTPTYETRLASFGIPAQSRTGNFGLEHLAGNPPHGNITAKAGENLATSESLLQHKGNIANNGENVNATGQAQTPAPKETIQPTQQVQSNPNQATALSSSHVKEPVLVSQPSNQSEVPAQKSQMPPIQKDTQVKPTAQRVNTEPLQGKATSVYSTPITPDAQVNVKDYINQQHASQEQARKAGESSTFQKLKDGISTKLIDNLSPIENTLKTAIKNGADVPMSNHITPQLDRALRADTIAGQYAKDNGLAHVIQNVPSTKEFDQYLIAKHAADLEKNGVKTGRNPVADKQLVDSLAPTYEAHAKAVTTYNNKLLDKAVEYGLVNKDVAAGLKKKYPNYVPANRIFGEGETNKVTGKGAGLASKSTQSVVQKIKGSERQIESPLASIANKTNDVINQGERNKAGQILASYKSLPGNPFSLRELKPSETVGTKPTIAYLENGKVRRFETTPEIEAAAKSLNKQQMNILGKIASVPTRVLRLGATGINPGFALANLAKDIVSAAINTEHSLKASPLNLPVLGKATASALYHGGKSYKELVKEGAGGTSFDIAREAPRATVQKMRSEKNLATKVAYTVTHPAQLFRAVEDTIGRSEEFTRAMQYYGNKKAGIDNGMTDYEARIYGANAARHNTVNFARHGDYGQVLNSVFPYLNAGIQGSRTFMRNIKQRPAQTLTKVAVLSTIPAITTTAWNLSDPNRKAAYNDISDYEKQANIIIVPPNPVKDPNTGRWNVIKIPVSQEIANLNNIARSIFETTQGNGALNPAQVIGDLVGTATSLNAGSPRQIANQVTPQALKPVIEGLTNQNLFTGNKIVPDSQKNLPAADQYGQYTSGTAKVAGSALNLPPRQIDNFVKTAMGGTGQVAVNALDNLLAKTGVIPANSVQGKSVGNSIESRFIGASSKPTADTNAGQFDQLRKQIINSDAYKTATQQDKAKMLNRLQADVNAVGYKAADASNPNNTYAPIKLTKNQTKLAGGSFDTKTYTTPTKTTGANSDLYKSNDAEFKALKTAYDQKVKDGTYTPAQKIKAESALTKAEVGSKFDKNTRDYYSLSKSQLSSLVSTNPDGKAILSKVLAYGDALKDSGIAAYNKFRNSRTGAVSLASSKGGRKTTGKGTKTKGYALATSTRTKAFKIKAPNIAKSPTFKAKAFKAPSIKQYAIAGGIKSPNVPLKKHSQVA